MLWLLRNGLCSEEPGVGSLWTVKQHHWFAYTCTDLGLSLFITSSRNESYEKNFFSCVNEDTGHVFIVDIHIK